jgi:hypothetical protein
LILWGGCDLVLGSSLPCARGGGHTGRTYPARPMPQGEEAGNAPGFPRLPRHGSRTSGREHLPLAFVARPRAASHPSAAAPGARPICAPLPRGGPGARPGTVPTAQRGPSAAGSVPGGGPGAQECLRRRGLLGQTCHRPLLPTAASNPQHLGPSPPAAPKTCN